MKKEGGTPWKKSKIFPEIHARHCPRPFGCGRGGEHRGELTQGGVRGGATSVLAAGGVQTFTRLETVLYSLKYSRRPHGQKNLHRKKMKKKLDSSDFAVYFIVRNRSRNLLIYNGLHLPLVKQEGGIYIR